jgi:hypothetical protein
MIELDARQRKLVADKLFDAANVAAGAMVFGQFVTDGPFSTAVAIVGLAIWITFVIASVALEGRSRG